jgi:hypothetical protein
VTDRGFASAGNRRLLQRGGGHYIAAEKLRGLTRPPPRWPDPAATAPWGAICGSSRMSARAPSRA